MTAGTMSRDVDEWLCPVCTGITEAAPFVGNPQQPPHKGSRRRARKPSAGEGSKPQVAAAKRANRKKPIYR